MMPVHFLLVILLRQIHPVSWRNMDLIYVNSFGISQPAAEEMSNIPTIINAAKLTGNSTTAQSFTAYIKGTDQDADGHYVNTLVYVFKNTFAETNESTHQSDLINVKFLYEF